MSTRPVTCPNCQKVIQVPEAAAGKRIKCKACDEVFAVPAAPKDKPTVAKPVAKPTVAKPAAKPAPPPPPPPPEANAPIPVQDDDDDDDDSPGAKTKNYGVTKDPDEDIARCPFCAIELDPPEAQVCINCGYDLMQRKRHRVTKTYALTGGDIFKWWLPAIIWASVLLFCSGITIYGFVTLKNTEAQWRKDNILVDEKVNSITGEKKFLLEPVALYVCCALITIILGIGGVPTIYKRIRTPKPMEQEKRK